MLLWRHLNATAALLGCRPQNQEGQEQQSTESGRTRATINRNRIGFIIYSRFLETILRDFPGGSWGFLNIQMDLSVEVHPLE